MPVISWSRLKKQISLSKRKVKVKMIRWLSIVIVEVRVIKAKDQHRKLWNHLKEILRKRRKWLLQTNQKWAGDHEWIDQEEVKRQWTTRTLKVYFLKEKKILILKSLLVFTMKGYSEYTQFLPVFPKMEVQKSVMQWTPVDKLKSY